MLQLFDKNNRKIALLNKCKNVCIESVLESGDKTLSFLYPSDDIFNNEIEEETYIRTRYDEFVVKTKAKVNEMDSYVCKLNVENLTGNFFDRFDSKEQPLLNALNLAVVGTGWTVNVDNYTKNIKRTVRKVATNSWNILKDVKKVYGVDIRYDTLNKVIYIYDSLGSDRGIYFIDSLNLKALQVQSNSYDFYTRIVPQGKNGLTIESVNGGVGYLENKKYSSKTLTYFWKDERYTNPQSLKEDALRKLNSMCIPYKSYIALISNLAKINEEYKDILDYKLGDIVTLISKDKKVKEKQRIVKTKEYLQDHSKDTVELANKSLNLDDAKLKVDEIGETIDNVTTDNGTLKGSTIDSISTKQIEDFEANVIKVTNLKAVYAEIETLKVGKADIQNLNAVTARIGTLESTKANITDLTSTNIKVANLEANKATITDLNAASGKISVLESKTASIDNLLAGNLTANNFKANSIVAGSGIIADGAIGDAQISSLNANKMRAGTLDTSLVTVCGPQGRLKILGNKVQIFDDVNNKLFERIMLGINDNNRASLTLRGSDGQTVLLTEEGLTKAGITDGFNKADDNSLNASKFDKNSIIRQVNGATESINGTRVQVGDRSLDVELSTQKNTITNNSKELSSQKATIQALDNAIKLKVDTQTYSNSISAINNNISTTNSNLNKATSELNILKGQVSSKVSQSDIDKTVNNIHIGGTNLVKDSAELQGLYSCLSSYRGIRTVVNDDTAICGKHIEYKCTTSGTGFHLPIFTKSSDKIGRTYTWSFWGKCNVNKSGSIGHESGGQTNVEFTTAWKKYTYTWNFIDYTYSSFTFYLNWHSGEILYIKDFKIEEGNKATDWTPAPEDIDKLVIDNIKTVTEKISTVESNLIQKTNSIEAGVKDLNSKTQSITTNVNNISRDLSNKINSNLNVAKAYTNTQINTVNTKVHNVESNLNILSDKINTKVSQSDIDKSITEMNFDDNNMLINSGQFNNTSNWNYCAENPAGSLTIQDKILKCTFKGYSSWGAYLANFSLKDKPFIINKEYTVVCKLKASRNQVVGFNICDGNGYNHVYGKSLNITTNWQIFKFSFKAKEEGNERQFRFIVGNLGYNFDLYIEFVKLVEGSTTSNTWCLSPSETITNLKLIDTKINNVSSELTQTRNSIQGSINSINSKTHSLETTLGGKANKQEVTEVNNKVTSIKAELGAITQRISSTEVKTKTLETTINGKASKQDLINTTNKVVSLENNLNGITNRVSSTESRINNVDGKVKNCATKSEFTEYKQNTNSFQMKVLEQGYINLIQNGGFEAGFEGWALNNAGYSTEQKWQIYSGGKSCLVYCRGKKSGIYNFFNAEPGVKYRLSFVYKTDSVPVQAEIGIEGIRTDICYNVGGWKYHSFTFVATKKRHAFIAYGKAQGNFYIDNIMVTKGSLELPYIDSTEGGIYSNTMIIDKDKIKCAYEDGSYAQMGRDGFEWWKNGMKHPYHCLMARGSVDKVNSGQTVRIWLPEVFRGKEYEIGWWTGNVFPANPKDCLFAVNTELVRQNKNEGWFEVKMSVMVRNPNSEGSPQWRGKANVVWIAIA